MRTTCAKTIPDWLIPLPAGSYRIVEIAKLTNQDYMNIYKRFYALEVERKRDTAGKYVYKWQGAKYYARKFLNERFS